MPLLSATDDLETHLHATRRLKPQAEQPLLGDQFGDLLHGG